MKKPIYIVSDNHFMLRKSNDEIIRREKIFNLFNHILSCPTLKWGKYNLSC